MLTVEELVGRMESCSGCCGGVNKATCGTTGWQYGFEDVAEVLASYVDDSDGYCSSATYALVKLKNGKFGSFWEWADTSGHGCQCGSKAEKWDTLDEAQRLGLDNDQREKLGIVLSQ